MLASKLRKKKNLDGQPINSFCGFKIMTSSHLYQYLSSFMTEEDYLKLMNTSKKIFYYIKRQTTIFRLYLTSWGPIQPSFSTFDRIAKNCFDTKRQIVLELQFKKPFDFTKYLQRWPNPYQVLIEYKPTKNDFDFNVFNNIPVVSLVGFKGIKKITSGLQNIQDLTISILTLESIYDMNVTGSLQKLTFSWCHALVDFPILEEQGEIIFRLQNEPVYNRFGNLVFEKKKISSPFPSSSSSYHSSYKTTEVDLLGTTFKQTSSVLEVVPYVPTCTSNFRFLDKNPFSFYYITEVEVSLEFTGVNAISLTSMLLKVKALKLGNTGQQLAVFPPVFYGTNLFLMYFDLSYWSTTVNFPNLKSLTIQNCIIGPRLPETNLPNLQYLDLLKTTGLQCIPSYPLLREMHLYNLKELVSIGIQPRLRVIFLSFCDVIEDLSFFDGQVLWTVWITTCPKILDLSACRNVYQLHVRDLRALEKFPPPVILHQDLIFPQRRRRVWDIEGPLGGTSCVLQQPICFEDMRSLDLQKFDKNLTEFQSVRNISRVRLGRMHSLRTTAGFNNIHHSLTIFYCKQLVSLIGLQNIPVVALGTLPALSDISGLGHHDHLFIADIPFIEQAARKYLADKKEGCAHMNEFHSVFSTIQALTLLPDDKVCDMLNIPDISDCENNKSLYQRLW